MRTRPCRHCGTPISVNNVTQHEWACGSPLRPNCPNCEDGGATCIYDTRDGKAISRICVRCNKVSPIEVEIFV